MVENQMTKLLAEVENARGRESPADAFVLREFSETTRLRTVAESSRADAGDRLDARIELGRTRLRWDESHKLCRGAIVALDPLVGEPVDVYVADRRVARGELLAVDGRFAVRVTECFS